MKSQDWMNSNEISLLAKQVENSYEVSLIYKNKKNFENTEKECADAIEGLFRFLAGKSIKLYGNDNSELNVMCPVDIDFTDIVDYTPNV